LLAAAQEPTLTSRHFFVVPLSIALLAAACTTGQAKPPYQETVTLQPCPGETVDARCQPYVDCAPAQCDAEYKQCLGADYKNGNFGGPCQAMMECGKACANVCAADCKCEPDDACTACIGDQLATCVLNKCINELYACADLPPPSQGGACSQLTICCGTLASDKKKDCETTLSTAKLGGDTACQTLLSTYQQSGLCTFEVQAPPLTTCSTNGGAATSITFKNNDRTRSMVTYWVDTACTERKYTTITPGQSYTQATYVGHPWRIRDSAGKWVKDYAGNTSAAATTVEIP
jgi:VHL beta domain